MYKYILVAFSLAFFGSCNQGNKKNDEQRDSVQIVVPQNQEETNNLSDVITKFVRAYASRDSHKINALIHPNLGLSIIYRPGVSDTFEKVDSLDFNSPVPSHYAYSAFSNDYALTYEKLPEYDCGTEKWNKMGFMCDTTAHPNQLSTIIAFSREFDEDQFSLKDLEQMKIAEEESYRIIITSDEPLIFHVRFYEGKWYVTTLDRAYAGCDA